MRFFVYIVLIAVAALSFASAGHHSGDDYGVDNNEVLYERTSPEVVAESDRVKTCPHGFAYHGKECTQVLKAEPSAHCPPGYIRSVDREDICAKYYDKVFECPVEFVREKVGVHVLRCISYLEPMLMFILHQSWSVGL